MVTILTTDHQIIPWLLITDKHDNVAVCRSICESLAFTLFDHPDMMVTISWIPGSTGFLPLKHVLEIASNAAATVDLTEQHPPPTIAALQHEAKLKPLKTGRRSGIKTYAGAQRTMPSTTHLQASLWNSHLALRALPDPFFALP
jgi:hypothetical protein